MYLTYSPAWQKLGWDLANCDGALLNLPTKLVPMNVDVAELRTTLRGLTRKAQQLEHHYIMSMILSSSGS